MLTRLAIPILLFPGAAFAHELPVAHAHPHGDWGLSALALLAVGAVGALVVFRAVSKLGHHKGNNHDPR